MMSRSSCHPGRPAAQAEPLGGRALIRASTGTEWPLGLPVSSPRSAREVSSVSIVERWTERLFRDAVRWEPLGTERT